MQSVAISNLFFYYRVRPTGPDPARTRNGKTRRKSFAQVGIPILSRPKPPIARAPSKVYWWTVS